MRSTLFPSSQFDDSRYISSRLSHFSGMKRKYASPNKKKMSDEACKGHIGIEQERRKKRVQKQAVREQSVEPDRGGEESCSDALSHTWQSGLISNSHRIDFGGLANDDVTSMAGCSSSSMTALGRFGVWHPEDSVVKKRSNLMEVPSVEALEHMYKLPRRRQRDRKDGAAGALLFDIVDPFGNAVLKREHEQSKATKSTADSASKPLKVETDADGTGFGLDESYYESDEGLSFADLHTGEDAIRYFTELDIGGPVQLVYCNRVASVKEFTPYDLVVVPRSELEPEHFIISATGMVHVEPGPGSYMSCCLL